MSKGEKKDINLKVISVVIVLLILLIAIIYKVLYKDIYVRRNERHDYLAGVYKEEILEGDEFSLEDKGLI